MNKKHVFLPLSTCSIHSHAISHANSHGRAQVTPQMHQEHRADAAIAMMTFAVNCPFEPAKQAPCNLKGGVRGPTSFLQQPTMPVSLDVHNGAPFAAHGYEENCRSFYHDSQVTCGDEFISFSREASANLSLSRYESELWKVFLNDREDFDGATKWCPEQAHVTDEMPPAFKKARFC